MDGTRTKGHGTIRKAVAERKRLFRMALASAGLSMRQWADGEGLTHGHVSLFINGHRPSDRMEERVEAFIAKHLRHVA